MSANFTVSGVDSVGQSIFLSSSWLSGAEYLSYLCRGQSCWTCSAICLLHAHGIMMKMRTNLSCMFYSDCYGTQVVIWRMNCSCQSKLWHLSLHWFCTFLIAWIALFSKHDSSLSPAHILFSFEMFISVFIFRYLTMWQYPLQVCLVQKTAYYNHQNELVNTAWPH